MCLHPPHREGHGHVAPRPAEIAILLGVVQEGGEKRNHTGTEQNLGFPVSYTRIKQTLHCSLVWLS